MLPSIVKMMEQALVSKFGFRIQFSDGSPIAISKIICACRLCDATNSKAKYTFEDPEIAILILPSGKNCL